MSKTTYTTIPGTDDADYWELKAVSAKDRSKTFVPKDRELHWQLLEQQKQDSIARRTRHKQLTGAIRDSDSTNKSRWVD